MGEILRLVVFKRCRLDRLVGPHGIVGCGHAHNCAEVCPVECIVMEPIHATYESWSWPYPITAHRNVAQAQEAS